MTRLSGVYAAVEKLGDGKTVACTGIALFNAEGRIVGEDKGGKLEWKTRRQSPDEIKRWVVAKINEGCERTGIRYEISRERIFLTNKGAYRRIVKKADSQYKEWLEEAEH